MNCVAWPVAVGRLGCSVEVMDGVVMGVIAEGVWVKPRTACGVWGRLRGVDC